jgi:hypothetical protein
MTASAISMIAVFAAANALIGQYGAIQGYDQTRMANGSARDATQFLDYSLRLAGFGIDPRWGIDFSYRCAGQPCRDSTTGPDELVVVSRDPGIPSPRTILLRRCPAAMATPGRSPAPPPALHRGVTLAPGHLGRTGGAGGVRGGSLAGDASPSAPG